MTNYYDILGISKTSSKEEIRNAYKKLTLKFHPDKNKGDEFLEEMYKKVVEANEILSNDEKKKIYDSQFFIKNEEKINFNAKYDKQYESEMFKAIEVYYKKYSAYITKTLEYDNTTYISKPDYMSVSKFLGIFLLMLIVFWLFKPVDITQNYDIWKTKKTCTVFDKPDKNSKKIGELVKETDLNALEETNYFIKINFQNENGIESEGYIRKIEVDKQN